MWWLRCPACGVCFVYMSVVFLGYLYIYACKVDNKRFCRLSMGLKLYAWNFPPSQYYTNYIYQPPHPHPNHPTPINTTSNRRRASFRFVPTKCSSILLEDAGIGMAFLLLYVSQNVHKMPKVTWKLIYSNIWALFCCCCYPFTLGCLHIIFAYMVYRVSHFSAAYVRRKLSWGRRKSSENRNQSILKGSGQGFEFFFFN